MEIVHENPLFVAVTLANVSEIQEIAGWRRSAKIMEIAHENPLFVAVTLANVSEIQEIAGWRRSAKIMKIAQEEHTAASDSHQETATVYLLESLVPSLLHVSLTKKHYRQGKANVIFSFTKPWEKTPKKYDF